MLYKLASQPRCTQIKDSNGNYITINYGVGRVVRRIRREA